MTPTEKKAREIYDKFYLANKDSLDVLKIKSKAIAKTNALICVGLNIVKYTELLNRMDNFSNESREVICQLLDNELDYKQHIEKL